jgi:DNA repair ATPase RecN
MDGNRGAPFALFDAERRRRNRRMEPNLQTIAELLTLRYHSLCQLTKEIDAGKRAFEVMDIEQIDEHTSCQADLCAKVQAMDEEIHRWTAWMRSAMQDPQSDFEPLKNLICRNESAQLEVAGAAQALEEFLRASGTILSILLNVNSCLHGTYGLTEGVPIPAAFFKKPC